MKTREPPLPGIVAREPVQLGIPGIPSSEGQEEARQHVAELLEQARAAWWRSDHDREFRLGLEIKKTLVLQGLDNEGKPIPKTPPRTLQFLGHDRSGLAVFRDLREEPTSKQNDGIFRLTQESASWWHGDNYAQNLYLRYPSDQTYETGKIYTAQEMERPRPHTRLGDQLAAIQREIDAERAAETPQQQAAREKPGERER